MINYLTIIIIYVKVITIQNDYMEETIMKAKDLAAMLLEHPDFDVELDKYECRFGEYDINTYEISGIMAIDNLRKTIILDCCRTRRGT